MNNMNRILITGSDGNLGGRLTKLLADSTEFGIIAVSSFPERIPLMIEREGIINTEKIIQMSSDEMFAADLSRLNIVGVVHFAFSRAIFPNKDIASSLDYSLTAFKKIVDSGIENAIYVSSQSVYGDTPEWRTENTVISPESIYAMAKYAGEKLFESCYMNSKLQHAVIRLDIVMQSQNLVKALCRDAKEKGLLTLRGGKQVFSYLDADDVPGAILSLLVSKSTWRPIYNVGPNRKRYTLVEVAEFVKCVAATEGIEVQIDLTEDDSALWAGMDSSNFIADTGWKPQYDIEQMIRKMFTSS